MKIVIDGRIYGTGWTGIGRYSEQLIKNLAAIDKQNQYIILLRKDIYDQWLPPGPNFSKHLADFKPYGIREQFQLPFLLRKLKPDFVHFLHFTSPLFYRRKRVVTVHDMTLVHYKNIRGTSRLLRLRYEIKYQAMRLVLISAIRGSKVITPTQFVKDDIMAYCQKQGLSVAFEDIFVTHEAVDTANAKAIKPLSFEVGDEFLLYVGNAYGYKNLDSLLEAFGMIAAQHPQLCLILGGKIDYFYAELQKRSQFLPYSKRIIFPGYVNDSQLNWLYTHAAAFVFPSLSEGFGLPPLEAMSFGTPVLSSDASCMPEVCGDAALYFDPLNPADLAEKIDHLLNDKKEAARLREAGPKHVKQFSWKHMAEQTLEVYNSVLK